MLQVVVLVFCFPLRATPFGRKIAGQTLAVSAGEVPEPVAVRCRYDNIPDEPFLYNKAGLPAAQFRTDDW